ncbi:MAG: sterol desaturase family protein [Pseudomonadota bacterium]
MVFLNNSESVLRLGAFISVLALMALFEAVFPRRGRGQKRRMRWATNLLLVVIDTIALRLALPIVAMGMAVIAETRGWGLLNQIVWPPWLEMLIAIIVLDFLIYWQHVASHRIPVFWRIHKVHHADRDIDVTTGVRFHPVEIILSMTYKIISICLLGPTVVTVFIFEVMLNTCAMFNHANLRLPLWLDKTIRLLVVTPDMHRVHHSAVVQETNSNYGFSLSIWDRVFGSYIAQPRDGHSAMTIGLSDYQSEAPNSLIWTLTIPFRRK